MTPGRRAFQAEGAANVKALRQHAIKKRLRDACVFLGSGLVASVSGLKVGGIGQS